MCIPCGKTFSLVSRLKSSVTDLIMPITFPVAKAVDKDPPGITV